MANIQDILSHKRRFVLHRAGRHFMGAAMLTSREHATDQVASYYNNTQYFTTFGFQPRRFKSSNRQAVVNQQCLVFKLNASRTIGVSLTATKN